MPYFDFHIHPVLKTQFTGDKVNPWESLSGYVVPPAARLCSDAEEVVQSQSSFKQLVLGDVRLACFALHSAERSMMAGDVEKLSQSKKPGLKDFVKFCNFKQVGQYLSNAISPFSMMQRELETLRNNLVDAQYGEMVIVQKNSSLTALVSKAKSTVFVFTIEGLHPLFNHIDDFRKSSDADLAKLRDELIVNFEKVIQQVPVISINITHLQRLPICNHGYGMQFIVNPDFIPVNNALHSTAYNLINYFFSKNVVVDIKHMSLKSRQQFYAHYKKQKSPKPPIICTHAGFTGMRVGELRNSILEKPWKQDGYYDVKYACYKKYGNAGFNPCTINLFDEDIREVLNTNGMIGLSLDQRILGFLFVPNTPDPVFGRYIQEKEYISAAEYSKVNDYFGFFSNDLDSGVSDENSVLYEDINAMTPNEIKQLHLEHFYNHVIHFLHVARQLESENGKSFDSSCNCLCIGSDFDGFINPINTMDSIQFMRDLKDDFITDFRLYAKKTGLKLEQAFVESFAEKLFFTNGLSFVEKRLPFAQANMV